MGMAPKIWNPLRLNVPEFIRAAAQLSGEWPAAELPRFAVGAMERPATGWSPVRWHIWGERRERRGAAPEDWMRLVVDAETHLSCQRCLQPATLPVRVDRWFLFANSEREAAELDMDREEDVLVATRNFDVREWIEDELLLALPIVPMHEVCPAPLRFATEALQGKGREASDPPHPFSALASLKVKPEGGAP